MKEKGGLLNDFKLYFESLPSEPKAKRAKAQKPQTKPKKNILENKIDNRLVIPLAYYLVFHRQRKTRNRNTVLSIIDDRENMWYNASMATNSNPETKTVLKYLINLLTSRYWISSPPNVMICSKAFSALLSSRNLIPTV